MESSEELLRVILEGEAYTDTSHIDKLYKSFQSTKDCYKNGAVLESKSNSEGFLERIRSIKKGFQWIPVPKIFFTRFIKSANISTALRDHANKLQPCGKTIGRVQDENFYKTLRAYNLAIAFASPDSQELALAFEKRAELLLRFEMADLAEADIYRARNYSTRSAKKLNPLQQRCAIMQRERCSQIPAESSNEKYARDNVFSLQTKNPNIQSVSDSVNIDFHPHCGRRLIATKAVKPGDVLMIDEPFELILENILKWDVEHCTHCSKPVLGGIPCDDCTFGWFCSESCQEEGAALGSHQYERNYLGYLKCSAIKCTNMLLAARILFKVGPDELYRIFKSKDPSYFQQSGQAHDPKPSHSFSTDFRSIDYSSKSYLPIYNLISHDSSSIAKSKSNAFKALLMCHLVEESSNFFASQKYFNDFEDFKEFVASLILRHMENIEYNAITLSELDKSDAKKLKRYGAAVYPVLCLVNHSCIPNCVPVRSLKYLKTSLVALKAIEPFEEFTFSYAPHFAESEFETRQKYLLENYNFECKCEACVNCWGPANSKSNGFPESQCNSCVWYSLVGQCPKCVQKDSEMERRIHVLKDKVEEIKDLIQRNEVIRAILIIKACLEFCSRNCTPNFSLGLEFQRLIKLVLVEFAML